MENIKNIKKLNNINLLNKIENETQYSVKINFNEKAKNLDSIGERGNFIDKKHHFILINTNEAQVLDKFIFLLNLYFL